MTRYVTRSGSIYDVDYAKCQVRRMVQGEGSGSLRITDDWRACDQVNRPELGQRLGIVWGWGRDQASAEALQMIPPDTPDDQVCRYTTTSPIVEIVYGVISEAA